jgi:hypothetical protein
VYPQILFSNKYDFFVTVDLASLKHFFLFSFSFLYYNFTSKKKLLSSLISTPRSRPLIPFLYSRDIADLASVSAIYPRDPDFYLNWDL